MSDASDDRGLVSKATWTGDLPAGWGPWTGDDCSLALLYAPGASRVRGAYHAEAFSDGAWTTYHDGGTVEADRGTATPRPGETLLAAAQREAVAALWRCDGFGVGEVRGLTLSASDVAVGGLPIALPGLPGLWRVTGADRRTGLMVVDARRVDAVASGDEVPGWGFCSAHRKPVAGCRICDLGLVRTLPEALEKLGVKKRVDARPAGDEVPPVPECGAESFGISCWLDAGHDGAHQSGSARWRGKKSQRSPVPPAIATPATDDAVGLVHEPFAPSAKAAAETMEVLRRVGDGDADELARLAKYLDRQWSDEPMRDGETPAEQAIRLLEDRREKQDIATRTVLAQGTELHVLRARVTDLESALDTAAGSLDGRDDEHAALLARVAELEALLTAPPVGSVAGLLAKMKEARKFARADRGPHIKGIVASYYHAEKMIKATLAAPTDAVGKVVAEAFAEHERIASLGPWDPMDHWAAICTEADSIKAGVAPGRDRLIRVMGEAIAGILACDAAKGGAK